MYSVLYIVSKVVLPLSLVLWQLYISSYEASNNNLQVAALFDDHPDLLEEFIRFLPDASAVASAHNASLGRQMLNRYDERSSAVLTQRGTPVEKVIFSLKFCCLCVYLDTF